ncbi:MAG: 2-C-methyl-D-erythritol 2,4-cyclodiphosphate synthase [Bacteroidales bacterium]|nr:2-C-methyl-D-erythritol 2,4-cyclodiphosphate synthase [Bacteroidales bacterium]
MKKPENIMTPAKEHDSAGSGEIAAASAPQYRIGNGYDVHALAKGLPLIVCGVEIEHSKGCIAHSDGDTPLHALCDALLGALALGDIGKHFPDKSEEYRGIDSKILLTKVCEMVKDRGYRLVNADITIILQSPRLSPYTDLMRQTVAGVLNCDLSRISVKATTTEHLGFTGREEGISAFATVLLERSSA